MTVLSKFKKEGREFAAETAGEQRAFRKISV